MNAHPADYETASHGVPSRYEVLGVKISAVTPRVAIASIRDEIEAQRSAYVIHCNVHTVMSCWRDPALKRAVNAAHLVLPDGMPLVWLGRANGHAPERVYGPDTMLSLCEISAERGYRNYFLGGREPVLEELVHMLVERFPGLPIAGANAPPFKPLTEYEEGLMVDEIRASSAQIVWVGLGTPKQDFWVARNAARIPGAVLIPVGAAFDFHAGYLAQAPTWMQRIGMEWLFRLLVEPSRLWRRYLLDNPAFIALVFREWLRGRRRDHRAGQ
jgi:N-acetylglucosaminyldiphosphoundecaprenol N-acetyl-beta-D-mannosaminyltransferase